jgi:hypothetical protein
MAPAAQAAPLPGKDALATAMIIEEEKDVTRGEAFITTGYYYMSSAHIRISGIEFDAGYHYAKSDKIGFGPRIRQAFSAADGFATLFTGLVLDMNYAITGSLLTTNRAFKLNDHPSARIRQHHAGGLIATASLSQFFINTTQVAVPFSGIGFGLRYDLPSDTALTYTAGVSIDRVTNTETMIVPVQVTLGIVNAL